MRSDQRVSLLCLVYCDRGPADVTWNLSLLLAPLSSLSAWANRIPSRTSSSASRPHSLPVVTGGGPNYGATTSS